MIDKDPTLMSVILLLPLLALYVLMALRIVERKYLRGEDDYEERWKKPIIDIRDAALVTIGLDFSEIARLLPFIRDVGGIKHEMALVIVLLLFHLSALFLSALSKRIVSSEESYTKSMAFNKLMRMYIAAILLLTNAVTINMLVGML